VHLLFFDQGPAQALYETSRLAPGKWSSPKRVYFGAKPLRAGTAFSTWSPDGKWFAVESSRSIVVIPADSGAARTVFTAPLADPAPETPVWSRDGRSIYFKSHDAEGHAMISVVSANGGAARVIVRFPDLSRPSLRQGFAATATRFYFPIEDRQSNVWIAQLSP
jgi:hypothetical protein